MLFLKNVIRDLIKSPFLFFGLIAFQCLLIISPSFYQRTKTEPLLKENKYFNVLIKNKQIELDHLSEIRKFSIVEEVIVNKELSEQIINKNIALKKNLPSVLTKVKFAGMQIYLASTNNVKNETDNLQQYIKKIYGEQNITFSNIKTSTPAYFSTQQSSIDLMKTYHNIVLATLGLMFLAAMSFSVAVSYRMRAKNLLLSRLGTLPSYTLKLLSFMTLISVILAVIMNFFLLDGNGIIFIAMCLFVMSVTLVINRLVAQSAIS